MGRLKIYDTSIPLEHIVNEREVQYLSRSGEGKLKALLHLNHVTVQMNGGKPLKYPQGRGIIIRKP